MKKISLSLIGIAIVYWLFFLRMPTSKAINACEEYKKNTVLMEKLHFKNDSLWDFTHHRIEEALPTDIDTLLKIRLLSLKQVKYITNYKYFPKLPNDVQTLIITTGEQDSIAADNMKKIMDKQIELQNAIWSEKLKLKNTFFGSFFLKTTDCQ